MKEICQKLSNVETKLTKLDKIEERLESMDKKFKTVDTEINSCNQRLNTPDDHKALKLKLDKITSGIESTKTESKNFSNNLLDIEVQSLENNLLFFAIDEHTVVENNPENQGGATGVTENQGGATGVTENQGGVTGVNENCVDKIMDFLFKMKIEDTKSIQIEKAYRLGKRKNGPTKPRPIVVKFTNFKDRAAVKNSSNRSKNTKYGISPHYPREN